ncbi:MAG: hypothetical protein QW794_03240 [Thermosphaera sp.]
MPAKQKVALSELTERIAKLEERVEGVREDLKTIQENLRSLEERLNGHLERRIKTTLEAYLGRILLSVLVSSGGLAALLAWIFSR